MSNSILFTDVTKQSARFAKALSHPVRLVILKHLSNQSYCYTSDFVKIFPLAQSTISQHLKELKDAGLIIGETEYPKIRYCINQTNWLKVKRLFIALFEEDFSYINFM